MSLLLYAAVVVVVVLGLLVARGAWLIGQGSDAEFEARSRAGDVPFANTGFQLLDMLRSIELSGWLARLEDTLGWRRDVRTRTARCERCRHTWPHPGDAGEPQCPNCGSPEAIVVS